jgi:hypothetical protein
VAAEAIALGEIRPKRCAEAAGRLQIAFLVFSFGRRRCGRGFRLPADPSAAVVKLGQAVVRPWSGRAQATTVISDRAGLARRSRLAGGPLAGPKIIPLCSLA